MLFVKKANFEDIEKEWAFVRDMPEDENGLTNAWHGISWEDFETKALPDMLRFERGENLPDWMVPETFLFLWEDDTIIGQFRIRHYLNDALREGAGHIGQFIAKEYRGKGYSKILNDAILKEAKKRGFKKIYLKSDLKNYYEKFGAIYMNELKNGEKLYYINLED